MRFVASLFALVALSRVFKSVNADVCSAVAIGDQASCFTLRASCHYIATSGVCATAAPATCQQFINDSTGCTASTLGCVVNSISSLCTVNTGSAADVCQQTYTTQAPCVAGGCYWNSQSALCWNSLASDVAANPCTTWTSGSACWNHGCNWNTVSNTCSAPTAGSGVPSFNLAYNSNISYANAALKPNSLVFTVD